MTVGSGPRDPGRAERRRGGWAGFVRRYGWRAYALPVLSAVTLWVLVHGAPGSAAAPSRTAHTAAGHGAAGHSRSAAEGRHTHGTAAPGTTARPRHHRAAGNASPVVVRHEVEAAHCAANAYRQLVLVSISSQHAWMCEGHRQVYSTPVTTGATFDGRSTPLGSWRVQGKERDRDLVGPGYRDHVQYWVPFNGDYGLHDAAWQKMPFGSPGYHQNGSHGCVHLPTPAMAWVYGWAKVDKTVVTIES